MSVITVICGPPGAGKTTLVHRLASPGDLLIDVDALYQALSGLPAYQKPTVLLPYVLAARDGALTYLENVGGISAWIVATAPKAGDRNALRQRFDARVVVLEVPPVECVRRIAGDERRSNQVAEWIPLVTQWWRDYEPDERDMVIR